MHSAPNTMFQLEKITEHRGFWAFRCTINLLVPLLYLSVAWSNTPRIRYLTWSANLIFAHQILHYILENRWVYRHQGDPFNYIPLMAWMETITQLFSGIRLCRISFFFLSRYSVWWWRWEVLLWLLAWFFGVFFVFSIAGMYARTFPLCYATNYCFQHFMSNLVLLNHAMWTYILRQGCTTFDLQKRCMRPCTFNF